MVIGIDNVIAIRVATCIADLAIGTVIVAVAIALIFGLPPYHNSSLCCILHGFSASNRQLWLSTCFQWLFTHLFLWNTCFHSFQQRYSLPFYHFRPLCIHHCMTHCAQA